MKTLTVSPNGQIALGDDLLKHLGLQPGQQIALERLPDGRIVMTGVRPTGKISDVFGFLRRKGGAALSVEEMDAIGPPTP